MMATIDSFIVEKGVLRKLYKLTDTYSLINCLILLREVLLPTNYENNMTITYLRHFRYKRHVLTKHCTSVAYTLNYIVYVYYTQCDYGRHIHMRCELLI